MALNVTRRTLTTSVALAAASLTQALAKPAIATNAAHSPLAQTSHGPVRGLIEKGVRVFKGIPYGASTAGTNRFRPAQNPAPWQQPFDAFDYGPQAPQPGSALSPGTSLREDCLVLNVWTPELAGTESAARADRPVMVWLHGGGFSTLSGSSPMYDGVSLCNLGDVVVVTLNHRLNVFGFLHLADLIPGFATSGNEGMLDIVHALKWVKQNIASFGGNPGNVTIFGESGGGRKVSTLMAMPAAQGLFHRAIIQSGPGIHLQPRDKATEVALSLLDQLQLKAGDAAKLQQLPVADILSAYNTVEAAFDGLARSKGLFEQRGFVPTVGVPDLPAYAFDPVASPLSKNVPLLVGNNRHEMALFYRSDKKIYDQTLTLAELVSRVRMMVGDRQDRVLSIYTQAYPHATAAELWVRIVSDRTYRFDSITLAQRKADLGPATYMYYFTMTSRTDPKLLAHHALEIPFVFNNLDKTPWTSQTKAEQKLALQMSSAWIAFARDGNPATPTLPAWPAYSRNERATMVLGEKCQIEVDPDAAVRRLWSTI